MTEISSVTLVVCWACDAIVRCRGACDRIRRLTQTPLQLLHLLKARLSFAMPTETSIVDAEDLKSRVRDLRRFL